MKLLNLPAPDPTHVEVRVPDSMGNDALPPMIAPNVMTLSPGCGTVRRISKGSTRPRSERLH